jgi:phosphate starvation-inducible protein PhoH and related proteins
MTLTLSEEDVNTLFGVHDENLRVIEDAFKVRVSARGGEVHVQGEAENVASAEKLLSAMQSLLDRGFPLRKADLMTAVRVLRDDPTQDVVDFFVDDSLQSATRKLATPRNVTQKAYLQAIQEFDMVFGIGPAGTGKTYLAVAMAAAALAEKKIKRIILCRPAVEAGEKLGFLPGDLVEKINPYLRPLYDSLYDLIGFEKVAKMLERNVIEIAPLAFMRGRTLSDAFIILDEAQNTTTEQMKMFLTRLGFGSKAVITGDITQVDLPDGRKSGLREAREFLRNVEGIRFVEFTEKDVVRHPLVGKIVGAYDRAIAAKAKPATTTNE